MQLKERIFYLDLVRALSAVLIVIYHFSVHFMRDNLPIISYIGKSGIGIPAVTIFFMISGAALIYNYGDNIKLKEYYKKRFLGIYPMFWIAYTAMFLLMFFETKGFFTEFKIYQLIYSVFAMDGYLGVYFDTVYITGEWFIGCIILIYLIFPLLKYIMEKIPKIFFIVLLLLYLYVIMFSNFKMPLNLNFIIALFNFVLGMYLMKYCKSYKWWYALIGLIIIVLILLFQCNNIRIIILLYNIIGYSLYFIFCFVGSKIKNLKIKEIVSIISKYSYAIFLVHHFIILKMAGRFENVVIDKYGIICVMMITFILIVVFSKILYDVNRKIINFFKSDSKKEIK